MESYDIATGKISIGSTADTVTTTGTGTFVTTNHTISYKPYAAVSECVSINAKDMTIKSSKACTDKKNAIHDSKNKCKESYNVMPNMVRTPDNYPGYAVLGIEVLSENKVVAVTIGDFRYERNVKTFKQVCREPDVFDLKYAVALALTKYLHRDPGRRLTTYGLERMTEYYLTYSYDFRKEVDRALRAYAKLEREKAMEEAKQEEIKRIKERRAAKQKRNRERRRERRTKQNS